MPCVLAIVSKAVFERDAKIGGKVAGVGTVVPFDRYASKNKGLNPAGEGSGALFLVTVRPPDEKLWLVGILESPRFEGDTWLAAKNTMPITDITTIKNQIKFTTGAGISAKKGALGMSLQTPRILADADVALLRSTGNAGAVGAVAAVKAVATAAAGAVGGAVGGAVAAVAAAVTPTSTLSGRGHLNAHEKGGPAPCLCRRCVDRSPEKITVDGLALFRDRAEGKGRFLWYWVPESLAADRDAIRKAVQSRLMARPSADIKKSYENLDKVFGSTKGKKSKSDDDDDDDGDDE